MISTQYIALARIISTVYQLEHVPSVDTAWEEFINADKNALMLTARLARSCFAELLRRDYAPDADSLFHLLEDLHIRKNKGYAGDNKDPWINFRECVKFGVSPELGVAVRMCDKYMRYKVLRNNPEYDMVQEGIADTLMDLLAYALIYICLDHEKKILTIEGTYAHSED